MNTDICKTTINMFAICVQNKKVQSETIVHCTKIIFTRSVWEIASVLAYYIIFMVLGSKLLGSQ